MKWLLLFAAITGIVGFNFMRYKSQKKIDTPAKKAYETFAVLELYTSEGCSSCPPADRLLPHLASLYPDIIPLSFHVDYWDHLGWKDPFSNSSFSERQQEYGRRFNLESIYTPQLIINGEYQLVGSNRSTAETDIKKVLKENATVKITVDQVREGAAKLSVDCHLEGDLEKTDLLAVIAQKHGEMNVKAGENSGKKLSHTNVVRTFVKQEAKATMNFEIPVPGDLAEDNFQLIVFTQQKGGLKITGLASYQPSALKK